MPSKPRRTTTAAVDSTMDDRDVAVLGVLQRSPRITMSALAREVGLSPPAVTERVQRLERTGVIAGYTTEVDPRALGLPITAFARIRPEPRQLKAVAELASRTPEVVECYRITGEDCFLLKLHAPAVEAIEDVLDRFLVYGQTTTSIVVSTPVPRRPLPLPH